MVKYEAPRYKSLGFYVGEQYRQFSNGVYETDDDVEIAVLDNCSDVVRIIEPEVNETSTDEFTEAEPAVEVEVKPAKTTGRTKASGK